MEIINNFLARIQRYWTDATPITRAVLTLGAFCVFVGISYALTVEPEHDFTPLAEQPLTLQQVGRITADLDKRGVPYKVVDNGTQVLIPRKGRGELLATLASSGVSTQPEGGDGLEGSLLATDFQQREHVRQALERSLGRDIASMTAIEWAEVHISPGTNSVFSRSNRKGAASVVVKIRPGFAFPKERAMSLKHLVAQAAHRYGVSSGSVAVVDHEARTLAPAEEDSELGLNTKAIALQRETEDDLAERIRSLLEPVVGMGRVRVQVRTKMNLNRVEERAELYDPENATVLSERKTNDNARTQRQGPANVAGTPGNIPQNQALEAARSNSRSNQDRAVAETNFAVPKTVKHTKRAIGAIERMSIAVLVDANAFADPSAPAEQKAAPPQVAPDDASGEDGEEEAKPLPPRPNREMILALVRDAVAFDTARGDTVTLGFQPFVQVAGAGPRMIAEEPGLAMPGWLPVTVVTVIGFLMIGFAMRQAERKRQLEEERAAAAAAAEEEAKAKAEENGEEEENTISPQMLLKDQVKRVTTENIAATVDIIKGWLSTTPAKG